MTTSTERPVLGVINTSQEVRDLLTAVFEDEGYRVISTFTPQVKRGDPRFEDFIGRHQPVVIIYDVAIPYEENWQLFQTMYHSDAGQRTRWVVTSTNKRALESLVGPTPALELIGKPYDLEQIIEAVRRAVTGAG